MQIKDLGIISQKSHSVVWKTTILIKGDFHESTD